MKIGKQIKVVSYYSPEAVEQLTQLSKTTRISKAEYLREALADLLNKHGVTRQAGRKPKPAVD